MNGCLVIIILVVVYILILRGLASIKPRSTRLPLTWGLIILSALAAVAGFFVAGPNYTLGMDMMFLGILSLIVFVVFLILDILAGAAIWLKDS